MSSSFTPNYGKLTSSNLIGQLFVLFCGGTLVVQAYIYHVCFPRDPRATKAYVYLTFLMAMLFICFNISGTYGLFATGYGDIMNFIAPHGSNYISAICTAQIAALLAQAFCCYRIALIKRAAWPVALFIVLVGVTQCASGIASGILYEIGANDPRDSRHQLATNITDLWIVSNVACAIFISSVTSYLLLSAAVVASTRSVVNNIVRLIIETNSITTTVAVVGGVLYAGFPNTSYFVGPLGSLPILYVNMLFATLNHRAITSARSPHVSVGLLSTVNGAGRTVGGGPATTMAGSFAEGLGPMSFAGQPENVRMVQLQRTSTPDDEIIEMQRSHKAEAV